MTRSTTRPARALRRTAGVLALSLAAAGVTTATSALLGVAPPVAQADPGDTYVPTGSSQLLQSEDLDSSLVPLDTATVRLGRNPDFSSCLGEGNRWTEVLPGSPRPVSVEWTRRKHPDESLTEYVAQAPTEAVAARWAAVLVKKGIKACRHPVYDFHYGPTHNDPVGAGRAHWAVSYTGTSTRADGGVAVVQLGTSVGFVQVNGAWGPSWQTMESVSKLAVDRLG